MILEPNKDNIKRAAEAIIKGDIIAFPTETVYGLGADGLNPTAVSKIFEAKNRPSFNPLILHIASIDQLDEIAETKSEAAHKICKAFWPGPLTIVLPKKKIVPEIVTAGNSTVAVRMPNHPIALEIIKTIGGPIAAPSANTFGFLSPTTAKHVEKQLGKKVEIILDGGKCNVGVESTIVEVNNDIVQILRPGGISIEMLKSVYDRVEIKETVSNNPNAPGQLFHHYAPDIPVMFFDEVKREEVQNKKLAGLFFVENKTDYKFEKIEILSETGEIHEAAANLFRHLYSLESSGVDLILVESITEDGLGMAIMDRLRKATNRYKIDY